MNRRSAMRLTALSMLTYPLAEIHAQQEPPINTGRITFTQPALPSSLHLYFNDDVPIKVHLGNEEIDFKAREIFDSLKPDAPADGVKAGLVDGHCPVCGTDHKIQVPFNYGDGQPFAVWRCENCGNVFWSN